MRTYYFILFLLALIGSIGYQYYGYRLNYEKECTYIYEYVYKEVNGKEIIKDIYYGEPRFNLNIANGDVRIGDGYEFIMLQITKDSVFRVTRINPIKFRLHEFNYNWQLNASINYKKLQQQLITGEEFGGENAYVRGTSDFINTRDFINKLNPVLNFFKFWTVFMPDSHFKTGYNDNKRHIYELGLDGMDFVYYQSDEFFKLMPEEKAMDADKIQHLIWGAIYGFIFGGILVLFVYFINKFSYSVSIRKK